MNTLGHYFRVTTFGESHAAALGTICDGVPPGLELDLAAIEHQLARRRPGQNRWVSPRQEPDQVEVLSGLRGNLTLGTPVALLIRNRDARPQEYADLQAGPRPSHADFTTVAKYGIQAASGGGRSSARETVARVAAGAIAEQLLTQLHPTQIIAYVERIGTVSWNGPGDQPLSREAVDRSPLRCPCPETSERMLALLEDVSRAGDSLGGIIRCVVTGLPPGLGEPVFDKLEAQLARAMLSLPASKGFDIGAGFAAAAMRGSAANDGFDASHGKIRPTSNHSGGVQGGITNGAPLNFRVAFKPVSTLARPQSTVTWDGEPLLIHPQNGRHDPCVVARAVPIVEAMTALVLLDAALSPHAPPPRCRPTHVASELFAR